MWAVPEERAQTLGPMNREKERARIPPPLSSCLSLLPLASKEGRMDKHVCVCVHKHIPRDKGVGEKHIHTHMRERERMQRECRAQTSTQRSLS